MGHKKEENTLEKESVTYRLEAPDGGYGYVIAFVVTIIMILYLLPLVCFGLIYGKFLSEIGSETTGTTLANGIFNTVSSFIGLIASGLLNMYSPRKVSFLGASIFVIGATGLIFTYNLTMFITFFGVIQGIGYGILMPAAFTAFNSYFDKKMALAMSIAQAVCISAYMVAPLIFNFFMNRFGYKGTLMIIAGLSVANIPVMFLLQPVKKYMKKISIDVSTNDTAVAIESTKQEKAKSLGEDALKAQTEPLLEKLNAEHNTHTSQKSLNHHHYEKNIMHVSKRSLHGSQVILPKPRKSIVSIGDRAMSVTTINDFREEEDRPQEGFWKTLIDSFDFSLLKSVRYLNLSIGMALSFTADMLFFPLVPLILKNIGYTSDQQTLMMTVYFASDLVSRILLSIVSGIVRFRSRYVFMAGSVLSAVFRFAWVSYESYTWKISILAILGFLRCFIQTPLPLTVSEECPDQFSTAYSLFMVINGAVSLGIGPLMSVVKDLTQSDVMVCHILTIMYSACGVAWLVEFTFFKKKNPSTGDADVAEKK